MSDRKTLSSKQKIMLLLSAAFLMSTVCFYLIFSVVYKKNIRDIVSSDMKDNIFHIREYVELIFENADNVASIFTANAFLQTYAQTEDAQMDRMEIRKFDELLKTIGASSDMVDAIDIYIEPHQMLFTSDYGATSRLDPDTVGWFNALMEQDFKNRVTTDYREHIHYWNTRSQDQVTILRPLYSSVLGKKIGFVAVNINCIRFSAILAGMDGPNNILTDEGGAILMGAVAADAEAKLADLAFINDYSPEDALFYKKIGREEYIFSRSWLPYPEWNLVSFCSIKELMRPASQLDRYLLILTLLNLTMAGITVSIVLHGLFGRLKKLAAQMERLKHGNFKVEVLEAGKDEFSHIFRLFNDMAEELNRLFNENFRLELLHKDAQLKLLHAQINPHFIYNIFNNMNWMLQLGRYEELEDLVDAVAGYYKLSLNEGKMMISVKSVMENLKQYVRIQKIRFRGRFDCEFDLDDSILDLELMNHMLQPVVENAIIHGTEPVCGHTNILIKGFCREDRLVFLIKDDGAGIDKERLIEIKEVLEKGSTDGKGYYALSNVNERIKICYGKSCGLSIYSKKGCGTTVLILVTKYPTIQDLYLNNIRC